MRRHFVPNSDASREPALVGTRAFHAICRAGMLAWAKARKGAAMKFMSEETSAGLITREMALTAAREAFLAAAGQSMIFPAVLGHGSDPANRISVKMASTPEFAGLKVGSLWPGNAARGLPRHNSAILLFDQDKGRIEWVIEAGAVNGYRTAAADAVAVDALARPDAAVLTLFGAGNQGFHDCVAIAQVRPIEQVLVVGGSDAKAAAFAAKLAEHGIAARRAQPEEACRAADIVVTATPSRAPLFDAEWIGPGTHVSSMGSDGAGKQELPPALFDCAAVFCDLPTQAVVMGDLQHFTGNRERIVAIGDVLAGKAPGRTSRDQITVFDSSGIALQDLTIARRLVAALI
jgi:ornithine cyclodeaminase